MPREAHGALTASHSPHLAAICGKILPQAERSRPRIGYNTDSGYGIVAFQYQPEANGRAERLTFRIPGGPFAPAQARQAIATSLEQAGGSKVALELLLLTSEVVTNAVE